MIKKQLFIFLLLVFTLGCRVTEKKDDDSPKGTYAYDAGFLKKYDRTILELTDQQGEARILLSSAYQGRVMSSTSEGLPGTSYGWINYDLIASGERMKQFNPVGGEERLWLGPEGGQYSLYFAPGDSFNIRRWLVPAVIDTMAYKIVEIGPDEATFAREATFINYSGSTFQVMIERKVKLLEKKELERQLETTLPDDMKFVGYQTENTIRNVGTTDWKKETGLISIWLLGMFTPTDSTTVIIPFVPQENAASLITTNYFGDIPADRLIIRDSVLYFRCDGKFRSKIGLPPSIARPIAGSFDFAKNVLTVILFAIDKNGSYVNSKWEMQREPYQGDVVNSYNDGALGDGSQLGPFYELESSSPALELKKGEIQSYSQTTCHFEGDRESLRELCLTLLGVDLNEVKH